MAGYRLPDQEGLQLTTPATDPEVLQRPQWPVPAQTGPEYHQPPPELTPGKTQQNTRIGGLRRSTFWVALALTVATVVAAVGAAVGGSLAVKSASQYFAPAHDLREYKSLTKCVAQAVLWPINLRPPKRPSKTLRNSPPQHPPPAPSYPALPTH